MTSCPLLSLSPSPTPSPSPHLDYSSSVVHKGHVYPCIPVAINSDSYRSIRAINVTWSEHAVINATGWRLDLHHQINDTCTRPCRQPRQFHPGPTAILSPSQRMPSHDAPPSLPKKPYYFQR